MKKLFLLLILVSFDANAKDFAKPIAALNQLQITKIEMMSEKNKKNFEIYKSKQSENFQKWSYDEQILKFKADSIAENEKNF